MKPGELYRFREKWFETLQYGWIGSLSDEGSNISSFYIDNDGKTATCLSPSSFVAVPATNGPITGATTGRKGRVASHTRNARHVLAANPAPFVFAINSANMMFLRSIPAEEETKVKKTIKEAAPTPSSCSSTGTSSTSTSSTSGSSVGTSTKKKQKRKSVSDERMYSWFEFLIIPDGGAKPQLFSWIFIEVDFDETSKNYLGPLGNEASVFHKYFENSTPRALETSTLETSTLETSTLEVRE